MYSGSFTFLAKKLEFTPEKQRWPTPVPSDYISLSITIFSHKSQDARSLPCTPV